MAKWYEFLFEDGTILECRGLDRCELAAEQRKHGKLIHKKCIGIIWLEVQFMGAYRYWWHYSGIVKRTQSIFGRAMPIPWIEITKEMYDDFLSED